MSPIITLDPEFSARFVMTLAHFLWQGAAIGLAVFVLGIVLRRASSRLRYGVFVAALLAMALCPPLTYSLLGLGTGSPDALAQPGGLSADDGALAPDGTYGTYGTYATDGTDGTSGSDRTDRTDRTDPSAIAGANASGDARPTAAPSPAGTDLLDRAVSAPLTPDWRAYTPYLILAYVAGVLLMLARLALGLAGGGRLRKRAERITDSAILTAVQRHAAQLRLRVVPVVAYCQRVAVPTVVGVIRPMILLPASLATGMPPQQVELLLLHELAHIRRYDHLINIAQRLIEAALFFHPALWYVSHRIRVEREHCCDDLVIAFGGERHAYAESLVAAAALATGARLSPAALAATGKPSQLRRRIHRLLGDPQPPVRLVRGGWVLTALVAIALVAGATQVANLNSAEPERENFAQAESAPELEAVTPVAPVDAKDGPAETGLESSDVPVVEERTTAIDPNLADPATTVRAAAARDSAQTGTQPGDTSAGSALTPVEVTEELSDKYNELSSQMKDPDWWLRKVAVQQIGDLPYHPQFVFSLILALKDGDARVQATAAEALAKQGDPQAVKHLVAALKEESQVREAAAEALTHFKPEELMPLLSLAARDEDQSVCQGAIAGLGKQNTPEAAAVLVGLLPRFYGEQGREPVRPPVPRRPAGFPALAEMWLGRLGSELVTALGGMDPEIARPALQHALESEYWKTRTMAALVIGESESMRDAFATQLLAPLLKDAQKDVRAAAALVLGKLLESKVTAGETPDPEVVTSLVPLLRDSNREVAGFAANALQRAGWQPPTQEDRAWFLVASSNGQEAATLGSVAFEPLVHALNADSSFAFSVREGEAQWSTKVIEALASLDDPRKVQPLIASLTRYDPDTTQTVAYVLGETGDPAAVEPLIGLLGNLDANTRYRAIEALGKLKDPRAVDPLVRLLANAEPSVQQIIVDALGAIGDPRAADTIRPLLDSEEYKLRFAATVTLGMLRDTESVPKIAAYFREMTNPQPGREQSSVEALVSIGGPVVEDTFIEVLAQDTNAVKRALAAEALGRLGSAKAIQPLLDAMLFDTDDSIKQVACGAIGQIGGEEAALVLSGLVNNEKQRDLYGRLRTTLTYALSRIDRPTSSNALALIFSDFAGQARLGSQDAEVCFLAAKTLAERGDARGKDMLEKLRGIPDTRIEATNALQELEHSPPEAETTSPEPTAPSAVQPDESPQPVQPAAPVAPAIPDQPGQLEAPSAPAAPNPPDQAAAAPQQTTNLTGPRLQFRWVLEGPTLAAPTDSEPDRTMAVADEMVLAEGDIASAEVQKDPNSEYYQVLFQTTEDGAKKLKAATEGNLSRKLAIVFDGRVLSAPVVRAPIGSSGAITGNLSEAEAEAIADTITSKRDAEQLSTTESPGAPGKSTPPNQTDPTDRSDPSDQPAANAERSARLTGPRLQFRWVVEDDQAEGATVLPAPTESEPDRTLAVGDEVVLYEGGITNAVVRKDSDTDHYEVLFEVNERWAERLLQATEQNKGKKLAIVFDGRILSAPVVQAAFGKSGSITGDFTQEKAETIANVILGANGQGDDEPLPEPILYDKEIRAEVPLRVKGPNDTIPEVVVPE
jgi:HEAT repeat protein/beta-lactamase regulating signal transducer with metallopeptidase domain